MIIDAVTFEVENSGYYDKLAAGIVLTGGGALLRHLPQLVKFKTGLDVRIGYPNEHLVSDVSEEINQPMFSTSIGLILKGYEYMEHKIRLENIEQEDSKVTGKKKDETREKGRFFDRWKQTLTDIFAEKDAEM